MACRALSKKPVVSRTLIMASSHPTLSPDTLGVEWGADPDPRRPSHPPQQAGVPGSLVLKLDNWRQRRLLESQTVLVGDSAGVWALLAPQPGVTPIHFRAPLGCALNVRRRPPPEHAGASLSLVPARPGVCGPPGVGGPPRRREAGRSHRPSLCERRLPWAAWRSLLGREPAQEPPLAKRSSPNSLACPGAIRGAYCMQLLSAGHRQNLLCAASQFMQDPCATPELVHNLLCVVPEASKVQSLLVQS